MKHLTVVIVLFFLIGMAGAGFANPAKADAAIDAFWDKFKAAVTKGDKQGVFSMTQLPVDLGYGQSRIRTQAQFMKNYKYIFAGEVNAVKCFETAKPEVDKARPKEFIVGCPFAKDSGGEEPFVYTFKLTRTGWRFVSFENINE